MANKEGIFSSIGLTSLYLFYVQLGRHLLPLIDEGKGLKNTLTLMFLFWTFLAILHLFNFNPSRRLANFGYVVWICAMAMSFISFCIAGDHFRRYMKVQVPEIITAMNLTQLPGLYPVKLRMLKKSTAELAEIFFYQIRKKKFSFPACKHLYWSNKHANEYESSERRCCELSPAPISRLNDADCFSHI